MVNEVPEFIEWLEYLEFRRLQAKSCRLQAKSCRLQAAGCWFWLTIYEVHELHVSFSVFRSPFSWVYECASMQWKSTDAWYLCFFFKHRRYGISITPDGMQWNPGIRSAPIKSSAVKRWQKRECSFGRNFDKDCFSRWIKFIKRVG